MMPSIGVNRMSACDAVAAAIVLVMLNWSQCVLATLPD